MLKKDSELFLDEVLTMWLRREDKVQTTGIPSWKTLVNALRQPKLGQDGIATRICTDKGISS